MAPFKMMIKRSATPHPYYRNVVLAKRSKQMFHYLSKFKISGTEYCIDVPYALDVQAIAMNAIKALNLTTSKFNPQTCSIAVYELRIKQGKIENTLLGDAHLTPPFAPITEIEYQQEFNKVVRGVPGQFHNYISSQVWLHKPLATYEEAIEIAKTTIGQLMPAITAFENTVKSSWRAVNREELTNVSQT
jgi:hypothetical protein